LKLSRVTSQTVDRSDAGFTIIEVLIALAVVAVSVVAIGSVMSTNTRGVLSLERHVALMQTTRMIMATKIPPRSALTPGTISGEEDGYRWTVDVSPLGGDNATKDTSGKDSDAKWIPELVRVRVRSPFGAVSDLRTVRLIERPSQ
jgi:general secretion pathway protein I